MPQQIPEFSKLFFFFHFSFFFGCLGIIFMIFDEMNLLFGPFPGRHFAIELLHFMVKTLGNRNKVGPAQIIKVCVFEYGLQVISGPGIFAGYINERCNLFYLVFMKIVPLEDFPG